MLKNNIFLFVAGALDVLKEHENKLEYQMSAVIVVWRSAMSKHTCSK